MLRLLKGKNSKCSPRYYQECWVVQSWALHKKCVCEILFWELHYCTFHFVLLMSCVVDLLFLVFKKKVNNEVFLWNHFCCSDVSSKALNLRLQFTPVFLAILSSLKYAPEACVSWNIKAVAKVLHGVRLPMYALVAETFSVMLIILSLEQLFINRSLHCTISLEIYIHGLPQCGKPLFYFMWWRYGDVMQLHNFSGHSTCCAMVT